MVFKILDIVLKSANLILAVNYLHEAQQITCICNGWPCSQHKKVWALCTSARG